MNSPSFYIDVATFFMNEKDEVTAIRILTNVLELGVDNRQLLRIVGYRLADSNISLDIKVSLGFLVWLFFVYFCCD